MDLFDLHCDTISKCAENGTPLYDGDLALNIVKGGVYDRRCQVFAMFIPDKYRGKNAAAYYKKLRDCFYEQMRQNSGRIVFCRNADDIEKTVCRKKQAAVLSVESGAALAGNADNVALLAADGVRIMSLTWNGENELACGVKGGDGGITLLGRRVVREMEHCGILTDVSHLNDRGFWELCDMGVSPIVATHSNLRSVTDHPRNLTDDQFRAIVRTGGVVGLNFYTDFLGDDPFDCAWRHIYTMLSLGGEDTVAVGSDFDGADIDPSLDSVEKVSLLAEYLLSRSLSETVVNKIMFNNALRVLGE